MKTEKSTDNLDDKAELNTGYDLLSDTNRLSKFINLDGFCDEIRELLQSSSDICSCMTSSNEEFDDGRASEGLESKYCADGMMKLDNREFVVLDQWIPKMNEAVKRLVALRDRMVTQ
ncbi:hypothetical protein FRC00_011091 [Tulasnella sp. 408]|nr:hypothetical protein FRC00_011091 [Tulasnella sp. 408]